MARFGTARPTAGQRTRLFAAALAIAVIAAAPLAVAQQSDWSGSFVHVTGTHDDTVFAAGGQVRIEAQVSDDVIAAGGTVAVETTTAQDVMVAGGTVTLSDVTLDDLIAAGGMLDIAAAIGDDAILFGGNVRVRDKTTIGGSARMVGGLVEISGRIARELHAAGGEIILNGTVGGNVNIAADRIKIGPTARIGGKLRYASRNAPEIDPGARIEGGVEQRQIAERHRERHRGGIAGLLFFAGAVLVGLGLLGVALHATVPKLLDDASQRLAARPFESLGIGLASVILVPLASVVLMAIVIGAPVALLALFLLAALTPPSGILLAYRIAEWARHRLARSSAAPTLASRSLWTLAGIVAIMVVFAIPFVGAVLVVLAGCAALGALVVPAARRLA